jgi:hypothetical protein
MSEFEIILNYFGKDKPCMYLGDAVYASFDGYQIWLVTTDGLSITNKIALEPPVFANLLMFRESIGLNKPKD